MITTRKQMRDLCEGNTFYANGKKHTVSVDSHLSGDAAYDGCIVYDENGDSWFESDFPESEKDADVTINRI